MWALDIKTQNTLFRYRICKLCLKMKDEKKKQKKKTCEFTFRMSGLGFSMTWVRLNRWNRASLTKPSLSLYRLNASQIWVSFASPVTCLHTEKSLAKLNFSAFFDQKLISVHLPRTFRFPSPERKSEKPASVARSPIKVIPGLSSTNAFTAASVTCDIHKHVFF